jgi:hypothetical protein
LSDFYNDNVYLDPTFEHPDIPRHGVNYSGAVVILPLQRRSFYYMVHFVIPCLAFSIINLIAFLVKPDSGERVGVSELPKRLLSYRTCSFLLSELRLLS